MATEPRSVVSRDGGQILESVIVKGDLKDLTPVERVTYYRQVCESIGVNPLTQPFQYITLNGRLTLYATRACTDQLRDVRHLTANVVSRERIDDVYVVTVRVTAPDGRSDESIGAVAIGGLKGDQLANALMKCETKGKRRATLSLVGLGWLDESEVETIPGAKIEPVEPRPPAPTNGHGTAPEPAGPPPIPEGMTMAKIDQRWAELWQTATFDLGLKPELLPAMSNKASIDENWTALWKLS